MSQIKTKFIGANQVTNPILAQMPAGTIKGNNTGSTANATDLTGTQVTAMLNAFTSSLPGLAPSSGGGTVNFLRADGTWAAPTLSGAVTAVSVASSNGFSGTSSGGTTPALTLSTTASGVLKGSGGSLVAATAGTDFVTPSGNITGSAGSLSATLGVGTGGTGKSSLTAYTLLAGGTTSTGAVQSLTAGTAGQLLMSYGSSALPSWESTLTVSGTSVGINSATGYVLSVATTTATDGIVLYGNSTAGNTVAVGQYVNLGGGSFSPIVQSGDAGFIYSGTAAGNSKGFVVASYNSSAAGFRMDSTGALTLTTTGAASGLSLTNVAAVNGSNWTMTQNTSSGSSANAGFLMKNDGADYGCISLNSSTDTYLAGANGIYFQNQYGSNYLALQANGVANISATQLQLNGTNIQNSVTASYGNTAGTSFTGGITAAITFPTLLWDTDSAYNTSTGVYTCPRNGKYRVTMSILTAGFPAGATNDFLPYIQQSGSASVIKYSGYIGVTLPAGTTINPGITVTAMFNCVSGDYLGAAWTPTNTVSLNTAAYTNYIEFEWLGY